MTIAAVVVDEEGAGNKGAGSGAGMVPGGGVRGERAGKKVVGGLVEVLKWKKGKKKGKGKGGIKEEFGREEWVEICQAGFFVRSLHSHCLHIKRKRYLNRTYLVVPFTALYPSSLSPHPHRPPPSASPAPFQGPFNAPPPLRPLSICLPKPALPTLYALLAARHHHP
jgi:hypothetical protein